MELEADRRNWVAAPIILAQASQVNAVVPFAMTPTSGMKMRVTYRSHLGGLTVDGVASMPGVFTMDSSGQGQAAVLNYNAATDTYS